MKLTNTNRLQKPRSQRFRVQQNPGLILWDPWDPNLALGGVNGRWCCPMSSLGTPAVVGGGPCGGKGLRAKVCSCQLALKTGRQTPPSREAGRTGPLRVLGAPEGKTAPGTRKVAVTTWTGGAAAGIRCDWSAHRAQGFAPGPPAPPPVLGATGGGRAWGGAGLPLPGNRASQAPVSTGFVGGSDSRSQNVRGVRKGSGAGPARGLGPGARWAGPREGRSPGGETDRPW